MLRRNSTAFLSWPSLPRFFSVASLSIFLVMAAAGVLAAGQTPTGAGTPESPAPGQADPGGFWTRLERYYRQDWSGSLPSGPAPPRRGPPSPLDSPPFPSADWSYGGSPVIGEADTDSYPLMTAWNHAGSRTKVYGWLEPGVDFSTSSQSNAPVSNDVYPNRIELDQVVVYVERLPDTVQRNHVDIGYHLTALYGSDYRFTTNKGYFSSQYLEDHHQYGFDPSLEYVDIYVPHVARGMDIRAGRYLSVAGIESQMAPSNYMYSHSLLYSVDPFTDTGVVATVLLNDRWLVQGGVSADHDVAPWTSGVKPSATACLDYTTKSVDDNFYLCANGINSGKYAYNNVQQFDAAWYHKFSSTWNAATEAYIMYQRAVPSDSGPIKPETNTYGATCRPGQITCFAPEYAAMNYLQKQLGAHDYLSFRSDLLNDKKGQRTGVNTKYTENTLSWNHWFGSTVQLRPEARFDHAWDRKSYNNGKRRSQFTLAGDLLYHF